jgi:flagellar biosynthesis/type III secretory pathway protein FliH
LTELAEQRLREERNQGRRDGWQEGEAKGRQEGEAKGRQEGEAKGRQEGEAKGRAADILLVLKTRGIAVPEEIEQRIAACTDPAVLSLWLTRAVTANSAAEVVAPTS